MHSGPRQCTQFDPIMSIKSGQMFLWEKAGDSWFGINGQDILEISQGSSGYSYHSFQGRSSWDRDFFRLDDDLAQVQASFSGNATAMLLFEKYGGLRVLRQDPEQCLFSFICASNTNIPMIRLMLRRLSQRFGRRVGFRGGEFFTFPSADSISHASDAELRACGLGYRAKAVKAAAERISEGALDLDALKKTGYLQAKSQLMELYGIGHKIADCVLLFSLDKLEAFPIDVWISRALGRSFGNLFSKEVPEKLTSHQYEVVSAIARSQFGRYAGYLQQLLYYDIRDSLGKSW